VRCSPFFGQKIALLKVDRRRRACGNCEKAERSWRGLFQASVGIRVLGGFPSEASVSTGLGFSFLFCSFFLSGRFPQENFVPGSPRNDDRSVGRPVALPFFVSWGGLPLAKVDRRRRLIAQGLMTPLVIVRVISTTPILGSLEKSVIHGIRGTAVKCGCIPRS